MAKIGKKIKKPVEPTEVDIYAATLIRFDDQLHVSAKDFLDYAEFHDVDPLIVKMIGEDNDLLAVATPRQWIMASKIVRKQAEQPTIDVVFQALLNGALGKVCGEKVFASFKQ